MNEQDWLIIHTLYKHKNVTNTARALYISQPSITLRIRQIEELLNTKIIERGNKVVTFTPAGEYLAKCAQDMLAKMSSVREDLSAINSRYKGVLRLSAPGILIKYRLASIISEFRQLYPEVVFEVHTMHSSDVIACTKSGQMHLGLVRNEFGWSDDEKILLAQDSVCAVSTREFSLQDLPNMVGIEYNTDGYYRHFLDKWWGSNFATTPNIGLKVSNLDSCREFVLAGAGYAILPSIAVEDVNSLHKIDLYDELNQPIVRKTWLIYKKETLKISLVELFVNFLKSRFHSKY